MCLVLNKCHSLRSIVLLEGLPILLVALLM